MHYQREKDENSFQDVVAMMMRKPCLYDRNAHWCIRFAILAFGFVTQKEENDYEVLRAITANRAAFKGSAEEGASRAVNWSLRQDPRVKDHLDERAMVSDLADRTRPTHLDPAVFFAMCHSDQKKRFHVYIAFHRREWFNTGRGDGPS